MTRRLLAILAVALLTGPASSAEPTYWQDIRPVLRRHCTVCHSARNLAEVDISGGFALDNYAAVLKNAKKTLVHPGRSGDSLLVQVLITEETDRRMPLGVPRMCSSDRPPSSAATPSGSSTSTTAVASARRLTGSRSLLQPERRRHRRRTRASNRTSPCDVPRARPARIA